MRGLLSNQPASGRAHLALGYDKRELSGFALPRASFTDLRILHATGISKRLKLPLTATAFGA